MSGVIFQSEIEELPLPVEISVISIQELDAKLSEAPTSILKQMPSLNRNDLTVENSLNIDQENPPKISDLDRNKKVERNDEYFEPIDDTNSFDIEFKQNINLKNPKRVDLVGYIAPIEIKGNEKISFSKPDIIQPKTPPKPRTADRITKVATERSDSKKIMEEPKKAIKASNDALKKAQITDLESPKEASSEITPEGEKNVKIVASGSILKSSAPLSRPSQFETSEKVSKEPEKAQQPIKRPSANELLRKSSDENQYDQLIAQLEADSTDSVVSVSAIEERNMIQAITQKLAKYWEQGILVGNSNFEKYVVKVEVEVNERGEILGRIKPLVPKVPKGRYAIAFRQASNALISARTLPIIPEKYPNGITFEINFDPESGFSF